MTRPKPIRQFAIRVPGKPTAEEIEIEVRRYAAKFRRKLRRLSEISPRHADLLFTFPAACVALVTERGSPPALAEALELVRDGAPLAYVACALHLPIWLRRLPPEAFDGALPDRIGQEDDAQFGCRVINALPKGRKNPNGWLQWVLEARRACGDEFAIWIAGQPIFHARRQPPLSALLPLAMFAWFSRRPELEAGQLMNARWTAKMSIERAAGLTRRWLHRVLQDLCLELPGSPSVWARTRQVAGFEFVPLLTSDQLAQEAVAMNNCLATYTIYVIHGVCRLYSIRRNGTSLATMDVRNMQGTLVPAIHQLLARGNSQAPPDVHEAARAWLSLQRRDSGDMEVFNWGTPSDTAFQRHVWQPYASAIKAETGEEAPRPGVVSLLHSIGALCILERT